MTILARAFRLVAAPDILLHADIATRREEVGDGIRITNRAYHTRCAAGWPGSYPARPGRVGRIVDVGGEAYAIPHWDHHVLRDDYTVFRLRQIHTIRQPLSENDWQNDVRWMVAVAMHGVGCALHMGVTANRFARVGIQVKARKVTR